MEGQGTGGPNLEPRVRHLEHSVESLHNDMGRMSNAIAGISAQVTSLAGTLESVAEKLDVQRTKRPDWGLLVALGAFMLAIGGAALWPVNQRVTLSEQYLIDRIDRIEERIDREHLPGR